MPKMITRSTFSSRLTEQRKLKKLSQKEVAVELGVSQALLSHYENGIREPGLDFVVRASEFFNVSCDYLLGRTNNSLQLNSMPSVADIPEDAEISGNTISRAMLTIAGQTRKDKALYDYMVRTLSVAAYAMLCGGVRRGDIPKNWLGKAEVKPDQYRFIMSTLNNAIQDVEPGAHHARKRDVPLCVQTVTSWVYDYLNEKVAELL